MVRCKSNTRLSSIKNNELSTAKAVHPNTGCATLAAPKNDNKPVILAQADTTVGFISQNQQKLAEIKKRPVSKPFITVYNSFTNSRRAALAEPLATSRSQGTAKAVHPNNSGCAALAAPRIPQKYKNLVRRAKKTTFIVKNRAFRVDHTYKHSQILRDLTWHYSTSANENSKKFDREFCQDKADIIVEDKNGLRELTSSRLLKINNTKIKALR